MKTLADDANALHELRVRGSGSRGDGMQCYPRPGDHHGEASGAGVADGRRRRGRFVSAPEELCCDEERNEWMMLTQTASLDTCGRAVAVPKSWGAYSHGLRSLSNNWGGYAHGRQAPVRSGVGGGMHAASRAAGAPGVPRDHRTGGAAGPHGNVREFGSSVGRALAGAEGGGEIHRTDLGNEQEEVRAARNLVQHPIHALTADAHPSTEDRDAGTEARRESYERQESTWRRTHMAAAEARVEEKEKDQEASMARLRQTIANDRRDLQEACRVSRPMISSNPVESNPIIQSNPIRCSPI